MRCPSSFVHACFSLGFGGSQLMLAKGKGSITSKMIREQARSEEGKTCN